MAAELWGAAAGIALIVILVAWGFTTPTIQGAARLPEPSRPAPPMPKCKSPRQEDVSQAFRLAAGDTLIVTCDRALSADQVEKIRAGALDNLPVGCKVMVLHGGLRVAAVVKASPVAPQQRPVAPGYQPTHTPATYGAPPKKP